MRFHAVLALMMGLAALSRALGAPYEPTDAEKMVGAKLHNAKVDPERIEVYKEFVELKNARIAEAAEAQRIARQEAEAAVRRADALADRLAVEAAAVGVERGDAGRKQVLLIAAEKNIALLRSQLEDARKRLKHIEEQQPDEPKFAEWVSSRVGYIGAVTGDERAGRQFGFAMAGALEEAQRELATFEGAVEGRTGKSFSGRLLAAFMCSLGVCLPLWLASCLAGRVTRSISYKQHLLIGHIFNMTSALGVFASIVLTRRDPLVMIVGNPAAKFVFCLFFLAQWSVMLLLLTHAVFRSCYKREAQAECILQLASYFAIILHMKFLTYRNLCDVVEGGVGAHVNWRFYLGYAAAFAALTSMTASTSVGKADGGLVRDVNEAIESGVGGVIGEVERLLGVTSGSPEAAPLQTESRFSHGGMPSRSSRDNMSDLPTHIDETSIGCTSKAT